MLLVVLLACIKSPPDSKADTALTGEAVDVDGDGFSTSEGDCDDTDDETFPGAVETCDGRDQDCDDEVDEGVTSYWYADVDGDGFGDADAPIEGCEQPEVGASTIGTDCDDAAADVYPGATETCDDRDEDCDTEVDEGLLVGWWLDVDGDGWGGDDTYGESCEAPAGSVDVGEDCDDTRRDVSPDADEVCDELDNNCDGAVDEGVATTWYVDVDGDGWGRGDLSLAACAQPTGYAAVDGDCDDADALTSPAGVEVCGGADEDCDGEVDESDAVDAPTWYADGDADGFGDGTSTTASCLAPPGTASRADDCDDTSDAVNPDALELCNDIDDDCDGTNDEPDAVDAGTWYIDYDDDGFGSARFAEVSCDPPTGYVANDDDCDDASNARFPGGTERCNDVDDDCDGTIDEADADDASTWYADTDTDGYGDPTVTDAACDAPAGFVSNDDDCDDSRAASSPAGTERCNGADDDCDGTVDEDAAVDVSTWYRDSDGDGYGDPSVSDVACDLPTGYVSNDDDCSDAFASRYPGATESCNLADDDCDGLVDDGVPTSTWYVDADGDGWGGSTTTSSCAAPSGYVSTGGDCNDLSTSISPSASERCNGADDDCDGTIDDGVLGTGASCPAEDCAEILTVSPGAPSGSYTLDRGSYTCDMASYGGGWTRVRDDAVVYGTTYDGSYYNTEGFTWDEVLFDYGSGSVSAHCAYPGSLTGCNNLGFQFGSESWGVAQSWGSSICGMSTTSYESATSYVGGYDFVIARASSTSTIRLGSLEGISGCTTSDNSGTAYVDIYVRR